MTKFRNVLLIATSVVLIGCQNITNDINPNTNNNAPKVDFVPVVLGTVASPSRAITATSTRGSETYLIFSPAVTAFASNDTGSRIGDIISVPFLDTQIDFTIKADGSSVLFDGVLADSSGWVKTWYYPSENSFKYEALTFIDASSGALGYVGTNDVVSYKVTPEPIPLDSQPNYYFGKLDFAIFTFGNTGSVQASIGADLYSGADGYLGIYAPMWQESTSSTRPTKETYGSYLVELKSVLANKGTTQANVGLYQNVTGNWTWDPTGASPPSPSWAAKSTLF